MSHTPRNREEALDIGRWLECVLLGLFQFLMRIARTFLHFLLFPRRLASDAVFDDPSGKAFPPGYARPLTYCFTLTVVFLLWFGYVFKEDPEFKDNLVIMGVYAAVESPDLVSLVMVLLPMIVGFFFYVACISAAGTAHRVKMRTGEYLTCSAYAAGSVLAAYGLTIFPLAMLEEQRGAPKPFAAALMIFFLLLICRSIVAYLQILKLRSSTSWVRVLSVLSVGSLGFGFVLAGAITLLLPGASR